MVENGARRVMESGWMEEKGEERSGNFPRISLSLSHAPGRFDPTVLQSCPVGRVAMNTYPAA